MDLQLNHYWLYRFTCNDDLILLNHISFYEKTWQAIVRFFFYHERNGFYQDMNFYDPKLKRSDYQSISLALNQGNSSICEMFNIMLK